MGSLLRRFAREGHRIDDGAVARSPHLHRRLLCCALAALLISALLGNRFLQASSAHAESELKLVGAHLMTTSEMMTAWNDSQSQINPYWFGPKAGFSYTCSSVENTEYVITYVPGSTKESNLATETYKIDTYASAEALANDPQGQDFSVDQTVTTQLNREILYNFGTMKLAEVRFPDVSEVVLLHFATPQTMAQIMEFADSLTPMM